MYFQPSGAGGGLAVSLVSCALATLMAAARIAARASLQWFIGHFLSRSLQGKLAGDRVNDCFSRPLAGHREQRELHRRRLVAAEVDGQPPLILDLAGDAVLVEPNRQAQRLLH